MPHVNAPDACKDNGPNCRSYRKQDEELDRSGVPCSKRRVFRIDPIDDSQTLPSHEHLRAGQKCCIPDDRKVGEIREQRVGVHAESLCSGLNHFNPIKTSGICQRPV